MVPRGRASGATERTGGPSTSVWVMLGAMIVAFFAFNYLESAAQYVQSQSARSEWEAKLLEAKQRQLELQDEFIYVSSDDYVAQVARAELGLIQPGDDVYVVLPRRAPARGELQPISTGERSSGEETGRFLSPTWWRSLFGE